MEGCKHKWVHRDVAFNSTINDFSAEWVRIDYYFCERCLEEKEIEKHEFSRYKPMWYNK